MNRIEEIREIKERKEIEKIETIYYMRFLLVLMTFILTFCITLSICWVCLNWENLPEIMTESLSVILSIINGLWPIALRAIKIALCVSLCVVLCAVLFFKIGDIKESISDYKKFKRGEFPPLYIDINSIDKRIPTDPRFQVSLEKRYKFAFSCDIRVPRKYLSDLTVKGDMPLICMEDILKMKNLTRLDLSRVRFMGMPDKDLLEQIFRKLEKLEVLMPPPLEYWVVEKGEDIHI